MSENRKLRCVVCHPNTPERLRYLLLPIWVPVSQIFFCEMPGSSYAAMKFMRIKYCISMMACALQLCPKMLRYEWTHLQGATTR